MQTQTKQLINTSVAGHHVMRLLITSYFIAMAGGLIPTGNGHALMGAVFPAGYEGLAFSAFVFTTAYLILLVKRVRTAALLLSLYVFWSGYIANFAPGNTLDLKEFWRDIAMIGGLLLTYSKRDDIQSPVLHNSRSAQPAWAGTDADGRISSLRRPDNAELPHPLALRRRAGMAKPKPQPNNVDNLFLGIFDGV